MVGAPKNVDNVNQADKIRMNDSLQFLVYCPNEAQLTLQTLQSLHFLGSFAVGSSFMMSAIILYSAS
jgi:hypothetical protein